MSIPCSFTHPYYIRPFGTTAAATASLSKGDQGGLFSSSSSASSSPPPTPTRPTQQGGNSRIPTRHSMHQPPKICMDVMELQDGTMKVLETPIGHLFATKQPSLRSQSQLRSQPEQDPRTMAYQIAHETIEWVEYLQLGHARTIPGSLYHSSSTTATTATETPSSSSNTMDPIQAMSQLVERMQQEGKMYMELRRQRFSSLMSDPPGDKNHDKDKDDESSSSSSDDDDDDDESSSSDYDGSSSDEEEQDNDKEDDNDKFESMMRKMNKHHDSFKTNSTTTMSTLNNQTSSPPSPLSSYDFVPPGPTVKMYDALLDGMACIGIASPMEYYNWAIQVLEAHELDQQYYDSRQTQNQGQDPFPLYSTIPTLVTYNASLRGIAKSLEPFKYDTISEPLRDDALVTSFALYNSLTHSNYLPRNSKSLVYMLQIVHQTFPPSRTKGNISVTFWDHACQEGILDSEVIQTLLNLHDPPNGPEFEPFLQNLRLETGPPQKFRRFVKKYKHSKHY